MDQATTICGPRLWIIVLAAGASRRLGVPKQLLRVHGRTLLADTLAQAVALGGDRVITVLGADHSRMRAHIRRSAPPVRCVYNRNWKLGMGSSLAAGVRALPRTALCALVMLCDQPGIGMRSLRRLLRARRRNAIIASLYAGRCGVPAIFPRRAFPALRRLDADHGARDLLNRDAPGLRIVKVAMPEAELDVDTPADAAALLRV